MTDGVRFIPGRTDRYTPDCQGKCMGTDRPVFDSPAIFARMPDGRNGLVCTCCVMPLRRMAPGIADAPNILPTIDQSARKRWSCDQCGYETVTLPKLKAKT